MRELQGGGVRQEAKHAAAGGGEAGGGGKGAKRVLAKQVARPAAGQLLVRFIRNGLLIRNWRLIRNWLPSVFQVALQP